MTYATLFIPPAGNIKIRSFTEEPFWISECCDHLIAAQGKSEEESIERLRRTILTQIMLDEMHNVKPLSTCGRGIDG